MSNFTIVSIVVTCLFVTAILIVDHVEVARANRIASNPHIQQWLSKTEEERSFDAYLRDIGLDGESCPIEELVAAHKQHEMIIKILKTV
jgi:hypothetical protein